MTAPHSEAPGKDLPEALIEARSGWSLVWLIPLLALAIGGWLGWKALSERGPDIVIVFNSAEGLEVGKTRVKFKDVEVGKVRDIQLNKDLSTVEISVRLTRSAGEHLSGDTRFWIVRPRISTSGISGLSTLISGIYIGMDPVLSELPPLANYIGLEQPPLIQSDTEGSMIELSAETLGSIDIGSPVYYRQIKVGEVAHFSLGPSGDSVAIGLFIKAPYDQLVRKNSRFWNASGFDLRLTSSGLDARLESLSALLAGGIAFDTPLNLEAGPSPEPSQRFVLYPNYASTGDRLYDYTLFYLMHFKGSLRGLNPGAPVEYRGIKIGEVRDIKIQLNESDLGITIPVLVALQPGRLSIGESAPLDPAAIFEALVARGLRAQLKSGNLITGQMYVDLEVFGESGPAKIDYSGRYPEFPTIEATLDTITRNLTDFVAKIDQIPLLDITRDIRESVAGIKKLVTAPEALSSVAQLESVLANLDKLTATTNEKAEPVLNEVLGSLKQLSVTLDTLERTIADDSMLYNDVANMTRELSAAARSIKDFTDYLQRNPNDLIFGKDNLSR